MVEVAPAVTAAKVVVNAAMGVEGYGAQSSWEGAGKLREKNCVRIDG